MNDLLLIKLQNLHAFSSYYAPNISGVMRLQTNCKNVPGQTKYVTDIAHWLNIIMYSCLSSNLFAVVCRGFFSNYVFMIQCMHEQCHLSGVVYSLATNN